MTTAVLTRLNLSGGKLMLALVLADHANPDGSSIFPSIRRVAWYTRQDTRTVQRQINVLLDVGWLVLVRKRRPGHLTREYRIASSWVGGGNLPGIPDRPPWESGSAMHSSPASDAFIGDTAMSPNSSGTLNNKESSFDDGGTERAARRRMHATVNGLSASKRIR